MAKKQRVFKDYREWLHTCNLVHGEKNQHCRVEGTYNYGAIALLKHKDTGVELPVGKWYAFERKGVVFDV